MSLTWKKINEDKVRHCWICPNAISCGSNKVFVDPSFYAEAGVPFCAECGDDMEYVCTEIRDDFNS